MKKKRTHSEQYKWLRLKKVIKENQISVHGKNFCEICNRYVVNFPKGLSFTIGGKDVLENLRVTCHLCNFEKNDKITERPKLKLVG